MMGVLRVAVLALLLQPLVMASDEPPLEASIRSAISKSLPLLTAGAQGAVDHKRKCFMCHNQALPVFALTAARDKGFPFDRAFVQNQMSFTADFLARNRERYLEGEGQGGQADMAGYALWMLDVGGWPRDETTLAVTEYFLKYQSGKDHWESVSNRPPSEKSPFTASYVSIRALSRYGTPEQQERIEARRSRLREWLLKTPATDTEDKVFRLRGLHETKAPAAEIAGAAAELLRAQREDGSWAQNTERNGDTYATGSALVALHETAQIETDSPAYQRGLKSLLATQLDDGSWHVVSHSKPFQTYFESGYPHGNDQFISIAAAGWATTALALALPDVGPATSSGEQSPGTD